MLSRSAPLTGSLQLVFHFSPNSQGACHKAPGEIKVLDRFHSAIAEGVVPKLFAVLAVFGVWLYQFI